MKAEKKQVHCVTFLGFIGLILWTFPDWSRACDGVRFLREHGFALERHVTWTLSADDVECLLICKDVLNCFSVNVNQEKSLCQINRSTKEAAPLDFQPKQGWEYLSIEESGFCSSSICDNRAGNADNWFHYKDTMYKFFHERKTWTEAANHCRLLGSVLSSISTKMENEFIRRALLKYGCALPFLGHWSLDGRDPDVRLFGEARYVKDGDHNVLYLNGGANTYAETPAVDIHNKNFTFSAWVKVFYPIPRIVHFYADWSRPWQFLFYYHRGSLRTLLRRPRGSGSVRRDMMFATRIGLIPVNQWTHVAFTWNKDDGIGQLYINGNLSQRVQSPLKGENATLPLSGRTRFDIGYKRDSKTTSRCYMRDLTVFPFALDANEIHTVYEKTFSCGKTWIGLNNTRGPGILEWSDGQTSSFSNWAAGQKDSLNDECAAADGNSGKWKTENCNSTLSFVCEKKA